MVTLYLATVLGWYLVIFSLFLLFRRETVRPAMLEILSQRGLFFILAIITLILGLLMVVAHNVWVMGWPVVVTLFAWLVLISAILRLVFPDHVINMGQKFLSHPRHMTIAGVVIFIIGTYLLFNVCMRAL